MLNIPYDYPKLINSKIKEKNKNFSSINKSEVIICHDMMNGYKKDNYLDLEKNMEEHVSFRFRHFMNSDIFIYFSHHLISIPPFSYIKMAHSLNNKILGTVIVEYISNFYDDIKNDLNNKERPLIKKLINLCVLKGYDGYLFNFEKRADNKITNIILWLRDFYKKLKEIDSNYELIWYDSLLNNGILSYSDSVHIRNKVFFDNSDKFFLDYQWREPNIKKMLIEIKEKSNKILLSVDMFGRSSGANGLKMFKHINIIKKYPVSLALFAVGFVYERNYGSVSEGSFDLNNKVAYNNCILSYLDTFNFTLERNKKLNQKNFDHYFRNIKKIDGYFKDFLIEFSIKGKIIEGFKFVN